MKIIIAGAGEVGTHLAKLLADEKHDIVVIETKEENLQLIQSKYDLMGVQGSAMSIQVLKEADIRHADLFIAVTHYEEVNITAAILGKKLGAKKTIARIKNQEYLTPVNKEYFRSVGIDSLIHPQKLAAREVINLLKQTGTTKVFEFSGGKLAMAAFKIDEKAPVLNKKLVDVAREIKSFEYRAVAITRENKTIIPRGSDKLLLNDQVSFITTQTGLTLMQNFLEKKKLNIKNIMILGGSRIGRRVAKELENQFNIKLLEIDKAKCERLADYLENTLVLNADGRNVDLLKEEGLHNMDAVIAVTGVAETNILSCLLAKKLGVKKTIAEIENIEYIELAQNIGIDTIINKKRIAASHIVRFTMNAEVATVQCLTASEAEVMEFVAHKDSPITLKPLKNINFPKGAIIGGVVRGKSGFIADGDTQIKHKDHVVVFALPQAIHKVEKLFA